MYRLYYTRPTSSTAYALDIDDLGTALAYAESLRREGMIFVTMVSDYHNMVGKSGASGIDSNYVPQMLS